MADKDEKTHFGYESVLKDEKASKVAGVFHSVASKYDIMNDLMSGGVQRIWKQLTIEASCARPGQKILDVAGGTGDLAARFSKLVGNEGLVILSDINSSMLGVGRDRLLDKGLTGNVAYVQADAENLPFENDYFDCITIAFGLRNVTNKSVALASMLRILKPGGKLLVLEFSKPQNPLLEKVYDAYSFNIMPKMGEWVANDGDSYRYLAESIRMHPDQEALKQMMLDAGFNRVDYHNMTGGIVALHKGFKA